MPVSAPRRKRRERRRANVRLAEEYDAAKERGEVRTKGGNYTSYVPEENLAPTAADLDVDRNDVDEARFVRDAERRLKAALDELRAKADLDAEFVRKAGQLRAEIDRRVAAIGARLDALSERLDAVERRQQPRQQPTRAHLPISRP